MDRPRLLVLSSQTVFPVAHGAAIRIANLLRCLASVFDVCLVVPARAAETARWLGSPRTRVIEPPRPGLVGRATGRVRRSLEYRPWRDSPFRVTYAPLWGFYPTLRRLARTGSFDVVVQEHVWPIATLGLTRRLWPRALHLLDAHNVESRNMQRYLDQVPAGDGARRRKIAELAGSIRRLECSLDRWVDGFWACSEVDLAELERLNPGLHGVVVANGVDTRLFDFAGAEGAVKHAGHELVFTGVLNYAPAEEGLLLFHREVWPLVKRALPDARLTLVGMNAPRSLYRLAIEDASVAVASSVPDIRPFLYRAAISICPLQVGSGTRLKILEAMSAGTPVVTTTIGAEGIPAEDRVHLRRADSPADFAAAVIELLRDRGSWEALRRRARRLAEEQFDWERIAETAITWTQKALADHAPKHVARHRWLNRLRPRSY